MQAPLGNIVRKILTNEDASKKLMQQIILGERFSSGKDEFIDLEDRKIKIHRVASLEGNTDKQTKK